MPERCGFGRARVSGYTVLNSGINRPSRLISEFIRLNDRYSYVWMNHVGKGRRYAVVKYVMAYGLAICGLFQ